MSRVTRVIVGVALVVASIIAMGVLTRYDYRAGTDAAELRLAWRAPVSRTVECREPTEQEMESLPIHMRQDEICEGRTVGYRLEVGVDGVIRHRSLEEAAGARGDRPMHVLEALTLEPGRRHVRVVFERADSAEAAGPAGAAAPVPARLVLDRRLEVGVRDVVLVTYDRDARRLELRRTPAQPDAAGRR